MTSGDIDTYREARGGGMIWFWAPLLAILFVGCAFSIAAYQHESGLSIIEALAAGFVGVAALIVGLFAAAVGVIIGLLGALFGIVAAGGAVAMTLFIVASPIIALVLLAVLLRRPRRECPDPSAH